MAVPSKQKVSRRKQILQALAYILSENPGARITTAELAKKVGVTEAALYRHFPSKAKMFEGLIELIENKIIEQTKLIIDDINHLTQHIDDIIIICEKLVVSWLHFAEKNPGMSRILTGNALTGEIDRLRHRVSQIFEHIELVISQFIIKHTEQNTQYIKSAGESIANFLIIFVEGRINQFVRSDFKRLPTEGWAENWQYLKIAIKTNYQHQAENLTTETTENLT